MNHKSPVQLASTFLFLGICSLAIGQKGLPAKQPFTATVNTMYPQHLDFAESMVNQLVVPTDFKTSVVATGLGKPRIMAMADDGSLYITRRDVGDVLRLSDKDGDGRFEDLKTVWSSFLDVHGISIYQGYIYLASSKILKRGKLNSNGSVGDTLTLISDLPDGGQHDNRMISFGLDGQLYMSVGSDCNDCSETNKEHATLLVMNPDGSHRRIFARGLRNTIGFDWHPQTKDIWGCDNGTDWRGDEIPPEELNKIVDGGDYGWPWVFGKQQVDVTREDPGGTTKEAYAKTTVPAVMTFPAHSAPIDFRFLGKLPGFPSEYAYDALVSWHGSWNRKQPEGYKIQRIHFVNGQPVSVHDFFSGFLSKDGKTRFGRPAGILPTKSGKIYVSDDENGVIYCIMASN
ncbi:glucose dehydrogenase [Spirosoma sp. HMF4905]|uniref:Glucose dehydrogenase n=1 Tax=Spirosoma arboris TaxID=2682092 RepID=A0A7K1S9F0_9BACT|nr:PQQ-dependent sugar dehydrogenase [Spirosoma arboris]MVM30463.1 glucose dehydrogenase [Spirosoma arboris]